MTATWNIPHTIALRYLLSGVALLFIILSQPNWRSYFFKNKILFLFFFYLIIHLILIPPDFRAAFATYKSQWFKFFLFIVIGAGAGLVLAKCDLNKVLLVLGLGFCIPPVLHLILSFNVMLSSGKIPWGHTGVSVSHGDIGYSALAASLFLAPLIFNNTPSKFIKQFSLVALLLCLMSLLIAQSRGGIIFYFFSVGGAFGIYAYSKSKLQNQRYFLYLIPLIPIIFAVFLKFQIHEMHQQSKWNGMIERTTFGFIGDDPLKINCEGPELIYSILAEKNIAITPEIERYIRNTIDGDGARILAARGAIYLSVIYPFGIDGSKNSYQIALTQYCKKPPSIMLANAHVGWLDTSLSIGIPGALLLLAYFLSCFSIARSSYKNKPSLLVISTSLMLVSLIWLIRSCFDSSQRDQMLEMQAFVMSYLSAVLFSRNDES